MKIGTWVSVAAAGPLSGVLVEDAGSGMLVVQIVVGEWMVTPAVPPSLGARDVEPE